MMLISWLVFSTGCTTTIIKPVEIQLPDKPVLKTIKFKNFQGRVVIENPGDFAENQVNLTTYLLQLESRIDINNKKAKEQ